MRNIIEIRPFRAAYGVSLAVLLALVPGTMSAQQNAPRELAVADPAAVTHDRAEALLETRSIDNWKQAATLLEQAALVRSPGDPVAVDERVLAAELFYRLGSLERAQKDLEAAAREAVAENRIYDAADILLRAALVAQARGLEREAIEYGRNVEWLARSPLLTAAQYRRIRSRLVWSASPGPRNDT